MTRPYRYITRQRADVICPECAAPKHRQSKRCAACYYDAQRTRFGGAVGRRDACSCGRPKMRESGRCGACYLAARRRGEAGPGGRPQPQSHPWRGKNKLLFRKAA